MHSYTLDEVRSIVMRCAKQYQKNLLNRKFLIIYRDKKDNLVKSLEIYFGKENYQHLTGIELIDKQGNIRKHIAELFYEKCVKNKLRKDEITVKQDGTTSLKLAALPIMMDIKKVTKIEGEYNGQRPYLIADKLVGNVNFCLGLLRDEKRACYVPASTLLEDIKKLVDTPSQVLAIFSKGKEEEIYKTIHHVAKGLNLYNVNLPEEIAIRLSLEGYVPTATCYLTDNLKSKH